MAKQHSTLIGADLHNPKGIGSENTDKILHLSQSVELVNVSGSILPNNHDSFTIGQPAKRFSTGSFGIINVGGGEFTSASLAAGGSGGSSFTAAGISGSLGANATLIRSLTAVGISGSSVGGPTASDISGSWQSALSSSLYLTQVGNTISGSANASAISGSLGENASLIRSLTGVGISGSFTPISSSISTRLTTEEANIDVIQGQLNQSVKTDSSPTFAGLRIQGDLLAERYIVSSSVSHITSSFSSGSTIFGDSADDKHEFTGSIQIDGGIVSPASISGSFTPISQSLSTRTTNLEGNPVYSSQTISGSFLGEVSSSNFLQNVKDTISGSIPQGTISSSLQLPSGIISGSNQLSQGFGNISGSVASTGSFGSVKLDGNFTLGGGYISVNNKGVQSQLRLYCEVSNAHYVALQAPPHADFGGNVTLTLPPTTDTLVARTTTDTLTNKTLTSPDINGGTIDDISRVSGSSASTGSLGSLIVDGASIDFSNLPTSNPNVAGRLYNDGGTVKISAG